MLKWICKMHPGVCVWMQCLPSRDFKEMNQSLGQITGLMEARFFYSPSKKTQLLQHTGITIDWIKWRTLVKRMSCGMEKRLWEVHLGILLLGFLLPLQPWERGFWVQLMVSTTRCPLPSARGFTRLQNWRHSNQSPIKILGNCSAYCKSVFSCNVNLLDLVLLTEKARPSLLSFIAQSFNIQRSLQSLSR